MLLSPVCPHLDAPQSLFPISPPLTSSPAHHQSHASNIASSVIVQSPYSRPPNDRKYDPFSSQLSHHHWWYSAGLFPTRFFAISVLCLSRVRGYAFSILKRVPGVPLILYRLCYFYFIIVFFFKFWTMLWHRVRLYVSKRMPRYGSVCLYVFVRSCL